MLLCRGLDAARGHVVFYTNRDSAKARELAQRPYASAALYWEPLSRRVRISGSVEESPPEGSDAYFASRPRLSQLAAWGSRQSHPIASRDALLEQLDAVAARFGGVEGEAPVVRPPFWGGYRIVATRVELWVGSRIRAHDRVEWIREASPPGGWRRSRLQP
jgi:pyridoxamine 5'-phosphate oxidase